MDDARDQTLSLSATLEAMADGIERARERLADTEPHPLTQQPVAYRLGDLIEALEGFTADLTAQIAAMDPATLRDVRPGGDPKDTILAANMAGTGLAATLRTARRQATSLEQQMRLVAVLLTDE